MYRGNGRLCLQWARRARTERAVQELRRTANGVVIPPRSVLIGQRHGVPLLVDPRIATRIVKHEARQEARRLGLTENGSTTERASPMASRQRSARIGASSALDQ
jgi:hypothetical protein